MTEFERKILDYCRKENLFEDCSGLVLAVSGGPDSMALLRFFEKNRTKFPFPMLCASVDHSIREESREEVSFVKSYCTQRHINFEKLKINIPKLCPKGVSTETFAREKRYEFFFSLKEKYGFSHIATAHTSDDNAETVLMNVIRGSALGGICGIPPKRKDGVVRPLLSCEKSELINYCEAENIKYFTDKTNSMNIYRRNTVRNVIIPLLEKENPSVKKSLNRLSLSARCDDDFISSQAEKAFKKVILNEKSVSIPLSLYETEHKAVLCRVIRKAFGKVSSRDLSYDMTENVYSLFAEKKNSDKVMLFDVAAVRKYDFVDLFVPEKNKTEFLQINAKTDTEIPFFNGIVKIEKRSPGYKKNVNCIRISDLENAVFRTRRQGDVFNNIKNGNKLLKKIFTDKKIPSEIREKIPVLEKDGKILWAAFVGAAFSERASDGEFYEIVFSLRN